METLASVVRRHVVNRSDGRSAVALADDIVIARRRMRHLMPLDIRPLPLMHSVAAAAEESAPPEQRERTKELALYVLAVHMWQAQPKTALR